MSDIITTKIGRSVCYACGYGVDAFSKASDSMRGPKEGDAGICLNCGEILVLGEGLIMQEPTHAQMAGFKRSARLWDSILAARRFVISRGPFDLKAREIIRLKQDICADGMGCNLEERRDGTL